MTWKLLAPTDIVHLVDEARVMPFKKRTECILLGLSSAFMITTVNASTIVYAFGGLLSHSLQGCLTRAKAAATKSGFTANQQEILDLNKKAGDFHASMPSSPLSMTIRCDPTAGIYAVGVSGIKSQDTFELLGAVVKAF